MSDLLRLKSDLRREMLTARANQSDAQVKSRHLTQNFLSAPFLSNANIIAAYWPIAGEIDICPLLHHLSEEYDKQVVLPVVLKKDTPLIFRAWKPGDVLDIGPHNTFHPAHTCAVMEPDTILVPLLACDEKGGRLGFGGGYYDRTLEQCDILKIGVAYDAQVVENVPMDVHDQRLDYVVTPSRVFSCVEK